MIQTKHKSYKSNMKKKSIKNKKYSKYGKYRKYGKRNNYTKLRQFGGSLRSSLGSIVDTAEVTMFTPKPHELVLIKKIIALQKDIGINENFELEEKNKNEFSFRNLETFFKNLMVGYKSDFSPYYDESLVTYLMNLFKEYFVLEEELSKIQKSIKETKIKEKKYSHMKSNDVYKKIVADIGKQTNEYKEKDKILNENRKEIFKLIDRIKSECKDKISITPQLLDADSNKTVIIEELLSNAGLTEKGSIKDIAKFTFDNLYSLFTYGTENLKFNKIENLNYDSKIVKSGKSSKNDNLTDLYFIELFMKYMANRDPHVKKTIEDIIKDEVENSKNIPCTAYFIPSLSLDDSVLSEINLALTALSINDENYILDVKKISNFNFKNLDAFFEIVKTKFDTLKTKGENIFEHKPMNELLELFNNKFKKEKEKVLQLTVLNNAQIKFNKKHIDKTVLNRIKSQYDELSNNLDAIIKKILTAISNIQTIMKSCNNTENVQFNLNFPYVGLTVNDTETIGIKIIKDTDTELILNLKNESNFTFENLENLFKNRKIYFSENKHKYPETFDLSDLETVFKEYIFLNRSERNKKDVNIRIKKILISLNINVLIEEIKTISPSALRLNPKNYRVPSISPSNASSNLVQASSSLVPETVQASSNTSSNSAAQASSSLVPETVPASNSSLVQEPVPEPVLEPVLASNSSLVPEEPASNLTPASEVLTQASSNPASATTSNLVVPDPVVQPVVQPDIYIANKTTQAEKTKIFFGTDGNSGIYAVYVTKCTDMNLKQKYEKTDIENLIKSAYPIKNNNNNNNNNKNDVKQKKQTELDKIQSIIEAINADVQPIKHLWFQNWPDHGAPIIKDKDDTMENLVKKMIEELEENKKKNRSMLIHCSAGVGRTGTVYVLTYLTLLTNKTIINIGFIIKLINYIRKYRMFLVQKDVQFEYILKYCNKYIITEESNKIHIPETIDAEWQKIINPYDLTYTSNFKNYTSKNRYSNILPYDNPNNDNLDLDGTTKIPVTKRIVIGNTAEVDPCDGYINASYLPFFPGFPDVPIIASQGPTDETKNDFKSLLVQKNVGTIVMVTNLKEGNGPQGKKCVDYTNGILKDSIKSESEITVTDLFLHHNAGLVLEKNSKHVETVETVETVKPLAVNSPVGNEVNKPLFVESEVYGGKKIGKPGSVLSSMLRRLLPGSKKTGKQSGKQSGSNVFETNQTYSNKTIRTGPQTPYITTFKSFIGNNESGNNSNEQIFNITNLAKVDPTLAKKVTKNRHKLEHKTSKGFLGLFGSTKKHLSPFNINKPSTNKTPTLRSGGTKHYTTNTFANIFKNV